MNEITTIGLDLAKNIFQVHGVDETGTAVIVMGAGNINTNARTK